MTMTVLLDHKTIDEAVADARPLIDMEGKEGQTGIMLLSDNLDAFAARALAARNASETLDLMYYLWHDDQTGRLLAREVVKAADRGVRVRLLLDDINPRDNDATYLALDSHPNIHLRLFNPSWARNGLMLRRLEFLLRLFTMTRRMHNKAWIADGRLAILGGRNIGDAYFDAAETNFRDLDVLLFGKAVADAQSIFEAFWKSASVKPIRLLSKAKPLGKSAVSKAFAQAAEPATEFTQLARVGERISLADLVGDGNEVRWTGEAAVISDPPEKALNRRRKNWLMKTLMPIIEESRDRLEIISPYFVPGRRGMSTLAKLVGKGVDVAVLTNSLAATDVAAVHGAYANYRVGLLKDGVKLYEFQPYAREKNMSVFGSKGASLHTKAFTVDDRAGFVGSFNFDPRSVSLNTEMGVLFEHPELVSELRHRFRAEASSRTSYRLFLHEGKVRWEGDVDGTMRQFSHEPEAGLFRRMAAAVIRFLPVESQL